MPVPILLSPSLAALLLLLGLLGCASRPVATIIDARQLSPPRGNLALGPTAEHARIATQLTGRSDWPSADLGYRSREVTYYSVVTCDEQSYYDRFGGMYHEAQSFQTGVRLR